MYIYIYTVVICSYNIALAACMVNLVLNGSRVSHLRFGDLLLRPNVKSTPPHQGLGKHIHSSTSARQARRFVAPKKLNSRPTFLHKPSSSMKDLSQEMSIWTKHQAQLKQLATAPLHLARFQIPTSSYILVQCMSSNCTSTLGLWISTTLPAFMEKSELCIVTNPTPESLRPSMDELARGTCAC